LWLFPAQEGTVNFSKVAYLTVIPMLARAPFSRGNFEFEIAFARFSLHYSHPQGV